MRKHILAALATGFALGAILLTPTIAWGQVAGSLWKLQSNSLFPVNSTWGITVPSLANLNCIGTNSSGVFESGTCGGGGGTPGGLNTQIQYNNSGSFGGITGATTDGTIVSLNGAHLLNPTINGAGTGLATLAYPNTSSSATITFPTVTGILATLAGTEALTNKSVNGVTLTTGGSATAFLNGTGSYTIPAGGGSGLSTTSPLSSSNLLVYSSSGAGSAYGVATSTLSVGTTLSVSGTLGALVGGTSATIGLNLANPNTWTGLQTFNNASTTFAGQLFTNFNTTAWPHIFFGDGTDANDWMLTSAGGRGSIWYTTSDALANEAFTFAAGSGKGADIDVNCTNNAFKSGCTQALSILSTGLVIAGNASTSQLSVGNTAYFGGTATSSVNSTGNFLAVDGSSSNAAYSFSAHINTGVYESGGILGFDNAGASLFWDSTASAFYPSTSNTRDLGKLANIWRALYVNSASTTLFSNIGTAYFGTTATTTINSDGIGSIFMGTNSILKLGTTTAGTLSVSSTGVVYSGSAAGLTGSGSAGQATFWTSSSAVSGDSNFFWDNTNKFLGLGSSTPTAVLSVSKTSSAATSRLFSIASSTNTAIFDVLGNGNIGIGTTSPFAQLSVVNQPDGLTASTTVYSTPGTYTFGTNAGAAYYVVTAWGAGGGGGAARSGLANAGAGGGAGAFVGSTTIPASITSQTIVIGAGGSGASATVAGTGGSGFATGGAGSVSGSAGGGGGGGSTSFGSFVIAAGGGGGGSGGASPGGGAGATGGSGGGSFNGSGGGGAGSTNGGAASGTTGGTGSAGGSTPTNTSGGGAALGGGGSAGGASGSGTTASTDTGASGSGGAAAGANGTGYDSGGGGTATGGGTAGGNPGAGGGGAATTATSASGGNGKVIVTAYFYVTPPEASSVFQNIILGVEYIVQEIDQVGHIITGGPTPTISGCGTSPSFIGHANDNTFTVQVGSVSATGCTVTFANAWSAAPTCNVSNRSVSITNALAYTVSTTAVTITQVGLTNAVLDGQCTGTQ